MVTESSQVTSRARTEASSSASRENLPSLPLTFIGCGNMGEALLKGALDGGVATPETVTVHTPDAARRQALVDTYGIRQAPNNAEAVRDAALVVLAVKPHVYPVVIDEIRDALPAGVTVLSITPPYTLAKLRAMVRREDVEVVRAMPNTPAAVGRGVTAVVDDPALSETARARVLRFAGTCGKVFMVDEAQMAGISALTGSGPAYIAMMLEAMAQGAIDLGIPAPAALELATAVMAGTAAWAEAQGEHPAVLRDRVCSAGGTTIAGVHVLEHGARGAIIDALEAAAVRFRELEDEASR